MQAALWLALFHNTSSLLASFHQALGDLDISISPWRQKGEMGAAKLQCAGPFAQLLCDAPASPAGRPRHLCLLLATEGVLCCALSG